MYTNNNSFKRSNKNLYFFKKKKKIFNINQKSKKALFIPPKCWLKIKFSKNQNSLITLCNYKYDKSEYILFFKEFKKKYY